jgi:hypothetical protein
MKSNNHYDFFIAGRWRNSDKVSDLAQKIRKKGYEAYCFIDATRAVHKIDKDPEVYMSDFEKRDWRNDSHVKAVFERDMTNERNSNVFVMLLPVGKSCHIEAGVAYGMGKKCILIGEQTEAESLYLIFSEAYPTVEDFLKTI